MRQVLWRHRAPSILILALQWLLLWPQLVAASTRLVWDTSRKQSILKQTHDLWYHGYDNYMRFAFPADELRPLSCRGRGPDWDDPTNFGNNDVAANVSLTLIDVLDTFIVLRDYDGFSTAVDNVIEHVSFDVDTKPQVFEITIRVLGGLLSGHIFASDKQGYYYLPWYKGELLQMAYDLGERLLPAFRTSTGIPYARTNLRYGVPKGEIIESCTAGAGSLIIEFATLSRLTGDDRFEKAAAKSFFAIWNRRSELNLVGNTVNIWTGAWMNPQVSGIGAGIDSFYEYALKWYIISGESEYLDIFQQSYAAIMRYSRSLDGLWFHAVNMNSGERAYSTIDSLSSFWPGLQVLAGDVENAVKSHLMYWNLWKRHSGMPEVFDVTYSKAVALQYPLRPEFIESTYYLYRATKDTFYLDVGERVLQDITLRSKVPCGLTGILDLQNNTRDDRMESFVLSETLKYLALLFDEDHPLHSDDSNTIFTTEGHILTLNSTHLKQPSKIRREIRGPEHVECAPYPSPPLWPRNETTHTMIEGVRGRGDFEWARNVANALLNDKERKKLESADSRFWHPDGWCEVPLAELYTYDFVMSSDGTTVEEDPNPGLEKLRRIPDGYVLSNVTGIRAHLVLRMDGRGYEITKLGVHNVGSGKKVYVLDHDAVEGPWSGGNKEEKPDTSHLWDVKLRFSLSDSDSLSQALTGIMDSDREFTATAYGSSFGARLNTGKKPRAFRGSDVYLRHVYNNPLGCLAYDKSAISSQEVVVALRGGCSFLEKLRSAKQAGAAGVLVISDADTPINPSFGDDDNVNDVTDIPLVLITNTVGKQLFELLKLAELHESQVMLNVEPEPSGSPPPSTRKRIEDSELKNMAPKQYLILAGRPILNLLIMV